MNYKNGNIEITDASVEDILALQKAGLIGDEKETNTPVPVVEQNVTTETKAVKKNGIYQGFSKEKIEQHYGYKFSTTNKNDPTYKKYGKELRFFQNHGYYSWENKNITLEPEFVRPDVDSYKTKYETVDVLKNEVVRLELKNKVHCSPTNENFNLDYKKWNDESFKYCDKHIKTYPKGSTNRRWLTWCHRFEYFNKKSMCVPVVVKPEIQIQTTKKEPQGVGSDHVIAAQKNGLL